MEHLEVVIFDEINDYKEKIKGLTFRQWIFVIIGLAVVVPTYIFLPKYTPISQDLASYIVLIEASVIGFFGFIKIQGLDAEKIVPYWYRHYCIYGKPLEYITEKDWEEQHQKKDKKQNKKIKNIRKTENAERTELDTNNSSLTLSKKELKKKKKQEEMLEKAKAKYGYMLNEESDKENKPVVESTIKEQQKKNNSVNDLINSLSPEQKEEMLRKMLNLDE